MVMRGTSLVARRSMHRRTPMATVDIGPLHVVARRFHSRMVSSPNFRRTPAHHLEAWRSAGGTVMRYRRASPREMAGSRATKEVALATTLAWAMALQAKLSALRRCCLIMGPLLLRVSEDRFHHVRNGAYGTHYQTVMAVARQPLPR